jgi:hypothetical protein
LNMGLHTVPQRYLTNFQDPDREGFVWLHDKQGGEPRHAAIKKVLQQKEFYSQEQERFLADEVELPGNKIIERLVNSKLINSKIAGAEAITEAQRLEMAVYIGTMIRRVPFNRRWTNELVVPQSLAKVTGDLRRVLHEMETEGQVDPELIARRHREIDLAEEKFSRESPAEVVDQVNDPLPSARIADVLFKMTWRVLISEGPQYFVTTDNPAFFFRGEGYGLGNEHSELSLPLSTTHALHGSWRTDRGNLVYMRVGQRTVREINKRLVSQADRLVIYHKSASWLSGILTKPGLQLNRIVW